MDGVVWAGQKLLPGVTEFLSALERHQKTAIFVTNNSTKSRKTYITKMVEKGLKAPPLSHVYCSSYAAAAYLDQQKFSGKAYVMGGAGIYEELAELGIETADMPEVDPNEFANFPSLAANWSLDSRVGAVIAGLDYRLNYMRIALGQQYILHQKAQFIATNRDVQFPSSAKDGSRRLLPGGATSVVCLETCTKQSPVVVGKPEKFLMDLIIAEHNVDVTRAVMIGDNLLTDILFGGNAGMDTIFVESGVSSEADIA
eukprot:CAMPEP_0119134096 /NCGR_PEP_ID=MMETSP1310-20130426/15535_1 /TAXON_ID=464262 /ORGANISM="Genus nov. species nov., Strain RCC2339" /LENGTH=255 /DNA_ID=CAMNT_0007124841 /DNA_START=133 /DNA_END=896 /DNA_ORIENTATION=+